MRFYCTSTGPIGGLSCGVLLYFNWPHRWSQLYKGSSLCVSHFLLLSLKTRTMMMATSRTHPTMPMMIPKTVPAVEEPPSDLHVWENIEMKH